MCVRIAPGVHGTKDAVNRKKRGKSLVGFACAHRVCDDHALFHFLFNIKENHLAFNQQQKDLATKAIAELSSLDGGEEGHGSADDILLKFVEDLGFFEVAEAWENVQPKWYA
jgi:hypothetical protein